MFNCRKRLLTRSCWKMRRGEVRFSGRDGDRCVRADSSTRLTQRARMLRKVHGSVSGYPNNVVATGLKALRLDQAKGSRGELRVSGLLDSCAGRLAVRWRCQKERERTVYVPTWQRPARFSVYEKDWIDYTPATRSPTLLSLR